MRINNKKAQIGDLSYGKAVSLILMAIIIAIIIQGVISGWLLPLTEQLESTADEVLILLHIKNPLPTTYDCEPKFLFVTPGGKSLMNNLDINKEQQQKATFTLCNNECRISNTGFGEYKIGRRSAPLNDEFTKKNPENSQLNPWIKENFYLKSKSLNHLQKHRDLYTSFTQTFSKTEKNTVEEFYNNRFTKRVMIYAHGENLKEGHSIAQGDTMDPSFLIWQNGQWLVYTDPESFTQRPIFGLSYESLSHNPERILYYGPDADKAIQEFRTRVFKPNGDDTIHYRISQEPFIPGKNQDTSPVLNGETTFKPIEEIAGDCFFGSSDQLDCDDEFITLKKNIEGYATQFLAEITPTEKEIINLEKVVNGKTLTHEGITYVLKVIKEKPYPKIALLDNDVEKFSFHFASKSLNNAIHKDDYRDEQRLIPQTISLDYLPLQIYQGIQPVITSEEDYMLPEEYMDSFMKVRRIHDFLFATCRGKVNYVAT